MAATDGVGTKLKIAIETGRHDTIGIDLVAMCVNDLVVQGAEPLFFLDYFACGKLDVEAARAVVAGIAEGCRQAGCALIGGETAEMPGMYAAGDYDLAGFAVGAVERGLILPRSDVAVGDVLIGLASSGVHSNGYSLVRRLVADAGLAWDAPAPFAPGKSLAEALLAPTRIYVKTLLAAIEATGGPEGAIKALGAHHRRRPHREPAARTARDGRRAHRSCNACRSRRCSAGSPRRAASTIAEMLKTFNCGIGMVIVAAKAEADAVLAALAEAGENAVVIGEITGPGGEKSDAKGKGDAWAVTYAPLRGRCAHSP